VSTILIADDEIELAQSLAELVRREGLTPVIVTDGLSALQAVTECCPDVILLDFRMPGMNGMEVLRHVKRLDENLPVVLITAYAEVRGAVDAIHSGAFDYLAKPFNHQDVVRTVWRALRDREMRLQKQPQGGLRRAATLRELLGPSVVSTRLIADVERVAKSDFSVLILGETGSGKEVIAGAIHQASLRADNPFVAVDAGAIPETLVESELFGHERGAFTGANQQKPGKFEQADHGTLFLDEISNMPLASQSKLLRVLNDKAVYRLGATKPVKVDVRLLAATNEDVGSLTGSGGFRRDLYFRLNEYTIVIPPLRERREDIPYFAKRFLDLTNAELSKKVEGFTPAALDRMLACRWPGNVRELRATVRRAVLVADDRIDEEHLGLGAAAEPDAPAGGPDCVDHLYDSLPLREIIKRSSMKIEREVLERTLHNANGNKAEAARKLRIDYKTIHTKIKEYGIVIHIGGKHVQEQ
jgi:two-component system nitrogen regulation response regulator GlnG